MNVTYTVQFKGFHEKAAGAVEKTLCELIAAFPKHVRMESAIIVEVEAAKEAASAEKIVSASGHSLEIEEHEKPVKEVPVRPKVMKRAHEKPKPSKVKNAKPGRR